MAVVEQLLRSENDGSISFGNYQLAQKAKLDNFEFEGDIYKVKTYQAMTKLEKNGMFVFESEPGCAVLNFKETAEGIQFTLESNQDAQVTVGLEESTEYEITINKESAGVMKTNLAGKLTFGVELENADAFEVNIKKA